LLDQTAAHLQDSTMFSKPLAFGLLALGCVTAAAGSAYIATRQNAGDAAKNAQIVAASTPADAPAAAPVSETEAPVSTARPAAPAPSAPSTPPSASAARSSSAAAAPARKPARPEPRKPAAPAAAKPPARTVPLPERASADHAAALPAEPVAAPATAVAPAVEAPTPVEPPPPPVPQFEEVILPSSSVIGLQLETSLSSETARIEDRVEARVTRDVLSGGRLAIPAGARVIGAVTQVDRGGKLKERARLAIRFHTVVLGDGSEVPLRTEPIMREGDPPAPESSKKIGGAAVGGAILGAILGGGKGAMIGGMTGAGGGAAAVMAGGRNPATFSSGTIVTARLASPVSIQVEKQ
jgi:type IV secretory pathway VirB10-like protein